VTGELVGARPRLGATEYADLRFAMRDDHQRGIGAA
jgi:hypothetical protein